MLSKFHCGDPSTQTLILPKLLNTIFAPKVLLNGNVPPRNVRLHRYFKIYWPMLAHVIERGVVRLEFLFSKLDQRDTASVLVTHALHLLPIDACSFQVREPPGARFRPLLYV